MVTRVKMERSHERSVSYVVERDVDLVVVQLIQTSQEFRDWLTDRLGFDTAVNEFRGVKHSVTTATGESDIEAGFQTVEGSNQIALIENKINASMQERQVERYFERGRDYLEKGDWHDFSVTLIAPEAYVSKSERREFDTVITYEQMMETIQSLELDGTEFFIDVFEESLEKRVPVDNSELTSEVTTRVLSQLEEFPEVDVYQTSNTQTRFESLHEDHPSVVLYNAYIPGREDGKKAIVRINLTGRDDVPVEEQERLSEVFLEEMDIPEGFELKDRPMEVVRNEIVRQDFDSREAYVDSIVSTLQYLIEYYHPRLVEQFPMQDHQNDVSEP